MNEIEVTDKGIILDGKLLKGVVSYELKNSANQQAELKVVLKVEIKQITHSKPC